MPYLIDGHNLIGAAPGIELHDPDDEARLISRLRAWCARTKTRLTVYFDRGAVGQADPPASGGVTVRFVRPPATADSAIARHLARLGREAPNWVVVTSDAEVAHAARRAGARTLSSAEFARRLEEGSRGPASPEKPDLATSEEEILAWEAAFRKRKPRSPNTD